jgi:hypothetical protein
MSALLEDHLGDLRSKTLADLESAKPPAGTSEIMRIKKRCVLRHPFTFDF